MRTIGVLLAAGAGTRFSAREHKLVASFRGRPVVAWSIDALARAQLDGHAIVTGAVDLAGLVPAELAVIENTQWRDGQATSLQAAVRFADERGFDALVIGLADQPLVPTSAWEAVAREVSTPVVTASFAGDRRPPVRLERSVWPLLPSAGDEGARMLMRARPELVSAVECKGEPIDIDTVEDLVANDR